MQYLRAQVTGVILICLSAGGCNRIFSESKSSESGEDLVQQNKQLRQELIQQRKQMEQLENQLTTLRNFPTGRMKHLVCVEKIKFGRFTRAYDENEDDHDDGLIVYLVLQDREGDNLKAAGEAEIEVWDLAADPGQRHLGRWHFDLEEFLHYWLGGPLANHFKFKLPWAKEMKPTHSHLTLKAVFREALTGRVFEIQKQITASVTD